MLALRLPRPGISTDTEIATTRIPHRSDWAPTRRARTLGPIETDAEPTRWGSLGPLLDVRLDRTDSTVGVYFTESLHSGVMSHDTPMRVDHTGIAVESIPAAEPVLFALGCRKLVEESVESRFRWAQYDFGQDASRLELIAPEAEDTFLTDFLEESGPGLHHVTLEVADVDAVVSALDGTSLDVVDYRSYEDWTEAFVPPSNPTGVLFQLFEYHEGYGAGRPPPADLYVDGAPLGAPDSA